MQRIKHCLPKVHCSGIIIKSLDTLNSNHNLRLDLLKYVYSNSLILSVANINCLLIKIHYFDDMISRGKWISSQLCLFVRFQLTN